MAEFQIIQVRSGQNLSANTILISKDLTTAYEIRDKQEIGIRVAQCKRDFKVRVSSNNKYKETIFMSAGTLKKLYLTSGKKYGVKFNNEEIRLGPVVGVMADVYGEEGKPFGPQTFFIHQLISSGKRLGQICFGFSPYGINWTNKTVSGYTYGNHGWIKSVFPMPEVVYPREKAYSNAARRIRNRLESNGAKLINPSLIGKWQTYKILSKNANIAPYIPDTRLITNFRQIDTMIKKYSAVYLKPVNGSQGKNIIKVVKKRGSSGYEYQYTLNHKLFSGSAPNLQQLRRYLRRVMGNRTYIVQKQINLIRSHGNILDVRILVQKDNTGKWGVTGMAGRVGRNGSITSNISSGGHGSKVHVVLKSSFKDDVQVEEITKTIKKIAVESAKTLEESIGKAGEMGIDIGVDKNGNCWFIEANLRPARQVFTLIGEKSTRMKSVVTPLLYARYLANFE